MAPHQEIEVKLRTDPDKIAKIRRSRWWRELEPVRRQSLHSVYFDTNDQQLRDCNISLRTRTDGHATVQTVKMLDDASDSVSRREWEALVPDPIPDPSLVIDPALPQDFRKLTSADLHPVFDVDVKRETRRLTSDRTKIDVSLDDGAVIAGQEREPVHEIELDLSPAN
jgi:triphosphatase